LFYILKSSFLLNYLKLFYISIYYRYSSSSAIIKRLFYFWCTGCSVIPTTLVGQVERTEVIVNLLRFFAIFTIINKILISKNCQILIFNNFFLKYYQLYRKTARDKNCLFSSHGTLRIFSEFFINFLEHFTNMRK